MRNGFDLNKYFKESIDIEPDKEPTEEEIDKMQEAWDGLKTFRELSHHAIQLTQHIILEGELEAGQRPDDLSYRDGWVEVGGHIPKQKTEEQVKSAMETLLEWEVDSQLDALRWHTAFETIHPFPDGNGRTGRLLYLWFCRENGIQPIIWRADEKQAYYDLVKSRVEEFQ